MANKQVENLMAKLGITEAEAMELIAYDKKVDKGEKTEYDLSPEKEKMAKKFANVTEHKVSATKTAKKVRENPLKNEIMLQIFEFCSKFDGVVLANPSREVDFSVNGHDFSLTLIEKRPKK